MTKELTIQGVLRGIDELRKSQEKTDEQIRATEKQMRETDERIRATEKQMRETDGRIRATEKQMRETDGRIRATEKQMRETDERIRATEKQMRETDEQMKKTDMKLDRVSKQLGNLGITQGDIAEDYFYSSLERTLRLGEIKFDEILKNVKPKGENGPEFDIVMLNGECIGLVEVKQKAHPEQIQEMVESKVANFKSHYGNYNGEKIYFGLATMVVNDALKETARKERIFLLTQKGDHIEVINDDAIPH